MVGLARKLEQRFHIRLPMVSGGNSSSIYLIEQGNLPEGINNLRLGESFLLGNDTAYGTRIPGTVGDALELEAEVIEIKEKPSLPVGEIGVDAFGHRPTYEDKGIMRRAIVADRLTSSIFWGPPGCGKTTLASIIAETTRSDFVKPNAVTSGVSDVRDVLRRAEDAQVLYGRST